MSEGREKRGQQGRRISPAKGQTADSKDLRGLPRAFWRKSTQNKVQEGFFLRPVEQDLKAARAWALRALGRRARSVSEVRDGLRRRGCPEGTIESVIDTLQGLGLLDDAQFAARWVAVRSERKHLGPLRLAQELRLRGVPAEDIRSALAAGIGPDVETRLARQAAVRKMRAIGGSGPRAVAALLRHLRSRGFSAEAIRKAIAGIGEIAREEEPKGDRE